MATLLELLNQQPQNITTGLENLAAQKVGQLHTRNLGPVINQLRTAALLQNLGIQQPQQDLSSLLHPMQSQTPAAIGINGFSPLQQLTTLSQVPSVVENSSLVPQVTPKARVAKKQTAAEKKIDLQRQREVDKETLPYYRDLTKQYDAAKKSDIRLNRMEELVNKEGGLPISTFYNLFKNLEEKVNPAVAAGTGGVIGGYLGGPFGAAIGGALGGIIQPVATVLRSAQRFTSPNTEEYEKLTNDFIRDAKNIFGNRITNQDLSVFMQMIPTLSNTDSGKRKIINNMKLFNKAAQIKYKAMEDIINQNEGRRPANLELLVEEKAAPKLEKLSRKFTSGVPAQLIASV